jgi:hypothetical protein
LYVESLEVDFESFKVELSAPPPATINNPHPSSKFYQIISSGDTRRSIEVDFQGSKPGSKQARLVKYCL